MEEIAVDESTVDEVAVGIRERAKRAVQGDLLAIAMNLFLTQGFEATTVDQIAATAGLSRRTFFRYFGSKDDVVTGLLAKTGTGIAGAVTLRPLGEHPWVTMRRAFDHLIDAMRNDEGAFAMTRMLAQSTGHQDGQLVNQFYWRKEIADALAPRLPGNPNDEERRLQAEAISGAAIACLVSAQAQWVDHDRQRSIDVLLDLTMGAVGPLN